MRAAISIGDLVRAVRTLGADQSTADEIAGILGLSRPAAPERVSLPGAVPVVPPEPLTPTTSAGQPLERSRVPSAMAEPRAEDSAVRETDVDPLPPEFAFRRPPREIPPLDSLLPQFDAPPIGGDTTLFVRRWQRGILGALVSVLTPAGGLDVARIVDQISRRAAVQRLPRRPVYTTRMGLQMLVDFGKGMWPYSADVLELQRLLRLIVATDAVSVLRFDRSPAGGVGRGPRQHWRPYGAPPSHTPVLVVSDFGLAGPVDDASERAAAWAAVATQARIARCPFIALTPFPASRWPRWLTGTFAVLQWDRAATAALAKRAAERATRKG
jgi:hypothetical protein